MMLVKILVLTMVNTGEDNDDGSNGDTMVDGSNESTNDDSNKDGGMDIVLTTVNLWVKIKNYND